MSQVTVKIPVITTVEATLAVADEQYSPEVVSVLRERFETCLTEMVKPIYVDEEMRADLEGKAEAEPEPKPTAEPEPEKPRRGRPRKHAEPIPTPEPEPETAGVVAESVSELLTPHEDCQNAEVQTEGMDSGCRECGACGREDINSKLPEPAAESATTTTTPEYRVKSKDNPADIREVLSIGAVVRLRDAEGSIAEMSPAVFQEGFDIADESMPAEPTPTMIKLSEVIQKGDHFRRTAEYASQNGVDQSPVEVVDVLPDMNSIKTPQGMVSFAALDKPGKYELVPRENETSPTATEPVEPEPVEPRPLSEIIAAGAKFIRKAADRKPGQTYDVFEVAEVVGGARAVKLTDGRLMGFDVLDEAYEMAEGDEPEPTTAGEPGEPGEPPVEPIADTAPTKTDYMDIGNRRFTVEYDPLAEKCIVECYEPDGSHCTINNIGPCDSEAEMQANLDEFALAQGYFVVPSDDDSEAEAEAETIAESVPDASAFLG